MLVGKKLTKLQGEHVEMQKWQQLGSIQAFIRKGKFFMNITRYLIGRKTSPIFSQYKEIFYPYVSFISYMLNKYCYAVQTLKSEQPFKPFCLILNFCQFCGQFRFQRLLNALLYNNTHKNNFTHVTYPDTLGFLISKSIYYPGEGYNNNPLANNAQDILDVSCLILHTLYLLYDHLCMSM